MTRHQIAIGKNAFLAGWSVVKMNPRLPKEGALDGVLSRNPDPPTMHAGMPRDPDLLARLKRMHEAKMKAKEENTVDFDPETAKYGINNLDIERHAKPKW